MSRPRLTCLCSSRDVCPVHDRDEHDGDRDHAAEQHAADDLADARADRARDERDERGLR